MQALDVLNQLLSVTVVAVYTPLAAFGQWYPLGVVLVGYALTAIGKRRRIKVLTVVYWWATIFCCGLESVALGVQYAFAGAIPAGYSLSSLRSFETLFLLLGDGISQTFGITGPYQIIYTYPPLKPHIFVNGFTVLAALTILGVGLFALSRIRSNTARSSVMVTLVIVVSLLCIYVQASHPTPGITQPLVTCASCALLLYGALIVRSDGPP